MTARQRLERLERIGRQQVHDRQAETACADLDGPSALDVILAAIGPVPEMLQDPARIELASRLTAEIANEERRPVQWEPLVRAIERLTPVPQDPQACGPSKRRFTP